MAHRKMLALGGAVTIQDITMFPLISAACLFGGMFFLLARVLLFVVAMVIAVHCWTDTDEV